MKRKKLKIDLSKKDIPEEIKDFILEQTRIIEMLNTENKRLQKEQNALKEEQKSMLKEIKELKKNFS